MKRLVNRDLLRDDAGYSLIELMVVLLIIGALLAIAIPTFMNAKSGAEDRTIQSNIQSALTNEIIYHHNKDKFCLATSCSSSANFGISLAQASAESVPTPSDPATVYVYGLNNTPSGQSYLCLLGQSGTGKQFGIFELASTNSTATSATYYAGSSSSLSCPTFTTPAVVSSPWSSSTSSWG
ncbi:MAG: type II secretion system protein [Acidimicrobiaceae bacterium]|nr:type II secretion system protein [Acidimicrobiaceae bacterium]